MVIFRFFKMAVAAILDFQICEILTVGTVKRVKLKVTRSLRPPTLLQRHMDLHVWSHPRRSYTPCFIKTGSLVISSYLCFGSYELHENFQKYIGGVACCEFYGINVCDSLTILC